MQRCRNIFFLLAALLLLWGVSACSGDDCPINNTVMGKMAFYGQNGEAGALTTTLTVSVARPQGDSVVLNQKINATEVIFPLNYVHETDTIIFDYDGGVAYDSIYVSHTNAPTLVSMDCGTAIFHVITSVSSTHHVIDTVIIKSTEVNYDERENIQVIFP